MRALYFIFLSLVFVILATAAIRLLSDPSLVDLSYFRSSTSDLSTSDSSTSEETVTTQPPAWQWSAAHQREKQTQEESKPVRGVVAAAKFKEMDFETVMSLTRSKTMVQKAKLKKIWQFINSATLMPVEGDIVECGVWKGGSSMNMAYAELHAKSQAKLPVNRDLWLFDTFEGLPEPEDKDGEKALTKWKQAAHAGANSDTAYDKGGAYIDQNGTFRWNYGPLETVQKNMEFVGYPTERIHYVKGKVEDTLIPGARLPEKIAVLRLDTDWYASTKVELDVLFPRLVPGGLLQIDDYCWWKGSREASDEWLKHHDKMLQDVVRDDGPDGECFTARKIKTATMSKTKVVASNTQGDKHIVKLTSKKDARCDIYTWHHPTRCQMPAPRLSHQELSMMVPQFAEMYKGRPIKANRHGGDANHHFSLWATVKVVQPKFVIESGVLHGQGTWIIRQAAGPQTSIFSLDPRNLDFLTYKDSKATYFMGPEFKDFGKVDWNALIPQEHRQNTLVVLDDHQSCVRRAKELLQFGFVHLWYDDNNNNLDKGDPDGYSFNAVCAPLPPGLKKVKFGDHHGDIRKTISIAEHEENVDWLVKHLEIYQEIPPLLDGCGWDTSLLSSEADLARLGLPSFDEDHARYLTLRPPYVKLKRS